MGLPQGPVGSDGVMCSASPCGRSSVTPYHGPPAPTGNRSWPLGLPEKARLPRWSYVLFSSAPPATGVPSRGARDGRAGTRVTSVEILPAPIIEPVPGRVVAVVEDGARTGLRPETAQAVILEGEIAVRLLRRGDAPRVVVLERRVPVQRRLVGSGRAAAQSGLYRNRNASRGRSGTFTPTRPQRFSVSDPLSAGPGGPTVRSAERSYVSAEVWMFCPCSFVICLTLPR